MRESICRDRFASWFVQSWMAGALVRLAAPVLLLSQLRIASFAGIQVRWRHLFGGVSINDAPGLDAAGGARHE